ncbi:MAG: toll/interleukin-1 receptor domain-containing protein [Rhizobacter sp.]|nr:toll/interleukin-1 receptor domain-containing protein [Rhizobacter sp.]
MNLKLVSPSEPASPGAAEPTAEYRYWAFLSYSHHDKAIAKRLQKQLETYRVPKRLVGRETSHGAVPPRVSPVFRDRDELHAGSDLKASVHEALSRSRWLIVVCTPDAARSPWVNREIIEFKKLHGERRVLALIARGEPFASDMAGREAEECFPPALRRALTADGKAEGESLEPIAADMRKEGDGLHRATLKLLAGMLGVPFDDLVRRDVQRRVRWLTALASASAVGVVVFAFLAIVALQARNEAQYQRQQAEGLIEFMLGDLRKKLEPVGRLEVLDSVGEKALGYYAGQNAESLDATALGHRSRAMHLIGEIRDLRGQPSEAQKAFEQAAQTTAKLLEQAPSDSSRLFDHAQSVFWVGYAAWKQGDGQTAQREFQEYLTLAQRLSSKDPANLDWRSEVAFAHANQGTVQLGMGQARLALRSLQAADALLSELMQQRPELRFELAHNHGWQADAFSLLGEHELALKQQQKKLALFRGAPDADSNRSVERGIASALNGIGLSELSLGRLDAAESTARASLQLSEQLAEQDAKNLFWQGDACAARLLLAESVWAQRRDDEVRRQLAAASACAEKLAKAGAAGLFQATVARSRALVLRANVSTDRGSDAKVMSEAEGFLNQSSILLGQNIPDRERLAVELARVALVLGSLQSAAANADAARETWRRADTLLAPYANGANAAALTALAHARLYLGDRTSAIALSARVQRTSYRHPDYADLVKQLQAGRGGRGTSKPSGARS